MLPIFLKDSEESIVELCESRKSHKLNEVITINNQTYKVSEIFTDAIVVIKTTTENKGTVYNPMKNLVLSMNGIESMICDTDKDYKVNDIITIKSHNYKVIKVTTDSIVVIEVETMTIIERLHNKHRIQRELAKTFDYTETELEIIAEHINIANLDNWENKGFIEVLKSTLSDRKYCDKIVNDFYAKYPEPENI